MNNAHIVGRKYNRYKRLVRRCNDMPSDKAKSDRKAELARILKSEGVTI